jgi:uncharacterized membrane protein
MIFNRSTPTLRPDERRFRPSCSILQLTAACSFRTEQYWPAFPRRTAQDQLHAGLPVPHSGRSHDCHAPHCKMQSAGFFKQPALWAIAKGAPVAVSLELIAETPRRRIEMQFQINGVYYSFTNMQIIVTAIVLLVVILIVVVAYMQHRKAKTQALRNRFGSEYDRAVLTHGSKTKAEATLADRKARVENFEIRNLGATERERFLADWQNVQARFVDHPKTAVTEADELVNALLQARGYPLASFEQRADDISVTYPRVMENYRLAHSIAVRPERVEASTEELRTAMIQYRAIFDELVQPQRPSETRVAA